MAASLVRNLVATAVVIIVALLVGFRPTAGIVDWLAALGLVALWILAITWLFAALGLVARSTEAADNYGFALMFLPYLSSAFVPTATMPAGLRWFAEHQPITPIVETIRGLLLGTGYGNQPVWAVGWCLLIMVGAPSSGPAGCSGRPSRAASQPDEDRFGNGVRASLPIQRQEFTVRIEQGAEFGRQREIGQPPSDPDGSGLVGGQPKHGEVAPGDLGHAIMVSPSAACSRVCAWSSPNGPTRVRRSAVRCPPQPSAVPRSRARARM